MSCHRALPCLLVALALGLSVAACGGASAPHTTSETVTIPRALLKGLRPIGRSIRFHPPVLGTPTGVCESRPGAEKAHIEIFAANRVVLIAGGVGIRSGPPRCFGNAVTRDPTGTVFYRPGATLRNLFTAWGEPLTAHRLASFTGTVRYYVAGERVTRLPALREHAEIVLEVGPYVPPHTSYTFPPGL